MGFELFASRRNGKAHTVSVTLQKTGTFTFSKMFAEKYFANSRYIHMHIDRERKLIGISVVPDQDENTRRVTFAKSTTYLKSNPLLREAKISKPDKPQRFAPYEEGDVIVIWAW